MSTDQQTKRRKTQERADRATYLSTDNVRALEAELGCCPASYHGMLNLLKRYIRLLTVLFGAGCSHLTEVQGVYQVLAEKIAVYETMSAELIAETLWRVFVDATECFSHLGPGLPESQLYSLRHDLRGCSLRVSGSAAIEPVVVGRGVPGWQRQRAGHASRVRREQHWECHKVVHSNGLGPPRARPASGRKTHKPNPHSGSGSDHARAAGQAARS